MSFAFASLILLGTAAAPASPTTLGEPDPKKMTAAEIRAHDAALERQHPNYSRCARDAVIGSLVATQRSCRTYAQWARADEVGNAEARDIGDKMASKSWNTN